MVKTRRENGAGTKPMQEPNGRWKQNISYRDIDTDELRRTTIRGATETEVKGKVKEFIKNIENGVKPNQNKITLQDWLSTWLEVNKKNTVSPGTYRAYNNVIKNHVKGTALGKMLLEKIKRADLQKFFNDKSNEVAAGSLTLIKVVISDALNIAEIDSMIIRNPCKSIKLQRPKTEKINPLSNEEISLLLDAAGAGTFLHTVIFFGLRTGARVGEMAGLRWEDIDFKNKNITIGQQAKYDYTSEEKLSIGTLKTDSSYRTIPLDNKLSEVLRWYQKRQEKTKADIGENYNPLKLVFPNDLGGIINPTTISKRFSALIAKLPMPKRSIHDLRHTFASVAICQGLSFKAVSVLLGHSKPSITLDVYSHLMPGDEKGIITAVAAYYDGKTDTVIDTVSEKQNG